MIPEDVDGEDDLLVSERVIEIDTGLVVFDVNDGARYLFTIGCFERIGCADFRFELAREI